MQQKQLTYGAVGGGSLAVVVVVFLVLGNANKSAKVDALRERRERMLGGDARGTEPFALPPEG